MKVNIRANTRRNDKQETSGKSMKILSDWKKKAAESEINEVKEEFNTSFDSIGSDIKVINGSFSKIKPMECPNNDDAGKNSVDQIPSTSGIKAKPIASSTPIYENISEVEEEEENNEEQEDSELDVTFNYQQDIVEERESCENYLQEVLKFVTKSQNLAEAKIKKRAILLKKLRKYQKKVKHLEDTIQALERLINFGSKMPRLFDNI